MGPPPAVVIVARHGARLDAVDLTWHLTSPTPYDPPLTYGGWTQSQALGAMIASLLHVRERSFDESPREHERGSSLGLPASSQPNGSTTRPQSGSRRGKRRKYKVIIHTSPFLRCIQTSIAISAGMAQFHGKLIEPRQRTQSLTPNVAHPHSGSPYLSAIDGQSQRLADIPEPKEFTPGDLHQHPSFERFQKPTLRIDGFLGEWLSPEYFEQITPPPSSVMMVAGTKAELLRRGEPIATSMKTAKPSSGNFPGGWASGNAWAMASNKKEPLDGGPLSSVGDIGQALPRRDRSSSYTTGKTANGPKGSLSAALKSDTGAYDPPRPTYALSPPEPIPRGYVAHARDACIVVDYQWDSMREPQNWPDGGEYGEEWSAMHKRFRKGLSQMIDWYKEHGSVGRTEHVLSYDAVAEEPVDSPIDEEEELVLILVTHGAGCNALIGGLTNQPVLLDVGMASLTMATRKETWASATQDECIQSPTDRRRSSVDIGLSQVYDMKLIASSEHLRAGVDLLQVPGMGLPTSVTQMPEYRKRMGSLASPRSPTAVTFNLNEHARSANSALGSIRRSQSTSVPYARPLPTSPVLASHVPSGTSTPSEGLWNRKASVEDVDQSGGRSSPSQDMLPDFGNSSLGVTLPEAAIEDEDTVSELPNPGPAIKSTTLIRPGLWGGLAKEDISPGLWGGPAKGDKVEHAKGTRRRWTVNENERKPILT